MVDPSTTNIAIPVLPDRIKGLSDIALNLWWTWKPQARELFKSINPFIWKETKHNPIKLLNSLSPEELQNLSQDEKFLEQFDYVYALYEDYMNSKSILNDEHLPVAYFCAEYGLHNSIPIYAGGLGFLAGDILKESSDMGLNMIGVGFMYPEGYVRQKIRPDGWQEDANEDLNRDEAPIERILDENGQHLIVEVPFINPKIYVAVWKVNVGKIPLYLLDTDIEQNDPWDRKISSHLYITDINQRLRQEIVLGIGGYCVLEKMGIKYSILHLNEGHPAFAILERIRAKIESGIPKEQAIKEVSETSIFTTHTPLQAATDIFPFNLMEQYFSSYWEKLNMTREEFLGLGSNPDDPSSGFNMTVFALRMCQYRNAVSRRHQEITKKIWHSLWKDLPEEQVPIDYVTNGVHVPTWVQEENQKLYNTFLGEDWIDIQDDKRIWEVIDKIPDKEIWKIKKANKIRLFNYIREIVRNRWIKDRVDPSVAIAEGILLDPDVLTIGFARRFTEYKRPDLIFYDLERIKKIINDKQRPVQIIFAGKAHPSDLPGKRILQKIFQYAHDPSFGGRIAFVEDYDEFLAKHMVHGVDVWLNNPMPPLEACGTSGMKASINGTIHLSVADGWWIEGYNGKNGWIFGEKENQEDRNKSDSDELYSILENQVIPLYYKKDERGIPVQWIKMMKDAIKSVTPSFCARRMLKDYYNKFYLPITKNLKNNGGENV